MLYFLMQDYLNLVLSSTPLCSFCNNHDESPLHLFHGCEYSSNLQNTLIKKIGTINPTLNVTVGLIWFRNL